MTILHHSRTTVTLSSGPLLAGDHFHIPTTTPSIPLYDAPDRRRTSQLPVNPALDPYACTFTVTLTFLPLEQLLNLNDLPIQQHSPTMFSKHQMANTILSTQAKYHLWCASGHSAIEGCRSRCWCLQNCFCIWRNQLLAFKRVFFAVFRYYLHVVKENTIETSLKPWQGNIALVFERSTSAFG